MRPAKESMKVCELVFSCTLELVAMQGCLDCLFTLWIWNRMFVYGSLHEVVLSPALLPHLSIYRRCAPFNVWMHGSLQVLAVGLYFTPARILIGKVMQQNCG
jgi:hypothetical protein